MDVDSHEFKTRFLNHLIEVVHSSEASETKKKFKVQMDGQLGRMKQTQRLEADAARPLEILSVDDSEDLRKDFLDAVKTSMMILKTEGHDDVIDILIKKIEEKEASIDGFEVSEEVKKILSSFNTLTLSSNVDEPYYSIHRQADDFKVLNHKGETDIELPESTYSIRCVKSRKIIEEEIDLEENTKVVFAFEEQLEAEERPSLLERLNPFA